VSLPVLVPCDRYRATLREPACVLRFLGREGTDAAPALAPQPGCRGCSQGAARAGAEAPAPVVSVGPVPPYRPGGRPRPYHPARDAAVASVRGGMSTAEAAALHGVTTASLGWWLAVAKVAPPPRRTKRHAQRPAAMEMLAAGADPAEVARVAGVALRTVHRWIADARASSAAAAGTALAPPASATVLPRLGPTPRHPDAPSGAGDRR